MESVRICPKCGHENPVANYRCDECGRSLSGTLAIPREAGPKPGVEGSGSTATIPLRSDLAEPDTWEMAREAARRESAAELLTLRDRHRNVWYKDRAKAAGLGILLVIAGSFLVWVLGRQAAEDAAVVRDLQGTERLVGEAIQGPKTYLNTIGMLAGVVFAPVGALVVLWSVGSAVVGVPKASKSPAESAMRFINHTFHGSEQKRLRLEAFVLLTRAARAGDVEDYSAFVAYADAATTMVRDALVELNGEPSTVLSKFEIEDTEVDSDRDMAIVSARITVTATVPTQNGTTKGQQVVLPPIAFTPQLLLQEVGGRWYMVSLAWNGYLFTNADGKKVAVSCAP